MQILEWVGGFLYAITTLYLLHRNNRIMQDQNQIMREQGGAARRIANERTWWKIYWPMLVMAALTVVTWSGIGYDIYDRHTYADGIHFKKQQGQIVYGKHFLNQEVELDNRFFEECTFENVTFVYHGTGNTGFKNTRANIDPPLKGKLALRTDNDAARVFSRIQNGLRYAPGITNFTVNSIDVNGNIEQLYPPPTQPN